MRRLRADQAAVALVSVALIAAASVRVATRPDATPGTRRAAEVVGVADPDAGGPSLAPGASPTVAASRDRGPLSARARDTSEGNDGSAARAPGARAPKLGPGVTAKTITIGVEVADRAATFGALGVSGNQGAREQNVRAVVDHLNDLGGITGRRIELVLHTTSDANGSFDAQAQSTCVDFTEDHRVFAGASAVSGGQPSLVACMNQHDTPMVIESQETYDAADFERWPQLYAPAKINANRWRAWIDSLARQKYFDGGARIGLVRFDTPQGKRIADGIVKPALRARGQRVVEEALITRAGSVAALSSQAASVQNAILRFQSARVNRVLFSATLGSTPFLWLPAAESQGFRPRYALTTDEFLDFLKSNAPANQLRGAVALGWWPVRDVAKAQDPGGRPGEAVCRAAFKKAGLTFPDRLAEGYALGDCDMILFIKAGAERAVDLTPDGFRAGVATLGGTYRTATAFGVQFAQGRRDGASVARDLRFEDGCRCWTYTGPPRAVP